MPKYVDIWDISLSLRYNMDSDDNLQFKALFKNMFVIHYIGSMWETESVYIKDISTDT